MAQYETPTSEVTQGLADSGLNPSTSVAIAALLTGTTTSMLDFDGTNLAPAGTQIVNVGAGVALTEDPGGEVIIMNANSPGASITLDTILGDRLLVAGGGDDVIEVVGNGNVTVETGGGNDSVTTGAGRDHIVITGGGNSTVSTGEGNDSVIITGDGNASVNTGAGNDRITLGSNQGTATVDGGAGFDRAGLDDSRGQHSFTFVDGVLTLNSAPTELSNVEVVEFNDGISIIADNATQAGTGSLYEVLFDREADLGGLEHWIDLNEAGASMNEITNGFVSSQEFQNAFAGDSNEVYVGKLYNNAFGREPDAEGLAYWLGEMENGMSQADVAVGFAQSQEAVQLMGIDGTQYIINVDIS